MKKLISLFLLFILVNVNVTEAGAKRKWGMNPQTTGYTIASGTAQLYTSTFNPRNFIACNDAAAGGQPIYINYSGITAAAMTTALVTTFKIQPQECYSVTFEDNSVSESFTIAIMTAAATADFRFMAERP